MKFTDLFATAELTLFPLIHSQEH